MWVKTLYGLTKTLITTNALSRETVFREIMNYAQPEDYSLIYLEISERSLTKIICLVIIDALP